MLKFILILSGSYIIMGYHFNLMSFRIEQLFKFVVVTGTFFLEFFKRQNASLAFSWTVSDFENYEPDLPDYTKRRLYLKGKLIANKNQFLKYIFKFEKSFKLAFSYLILLFMVRVILIIK